MINTELAMKVFTELMEDLRANHQFDDFLESDGGSSDFTDWSYHAFNGEMACCSNGSWAGACYQNEDYLITNGCCRFVIANEHYPFVFKADFYKEDKYCVKEYENYSLVANEGLEMFVANIERLTEYAGFTFYVMERANCDYDTTCDTMQEYLVDLAIADGEYDGDRITAYDDIYWTGDSDRVDEFLDAYYNAESNHIATMWGLFSVLCSKHHINDIHAGNIGRIGDRWVLVDYSGYFD